MTVKIDIAFHADKSESHGLCFFERILQEFKSVALSLKIWILANDKEYFISYKDYPVFENASIKQIAAVTTDFSGNLHWEELDADIELDSLENPEDYP